MLAPALWTLQQKKKIKKMGKRELLTDRQTDRQTKCAEYQVRLNWI